MLELLVVMAIMSILAVLTILSFSAMGKRNSREGAAESIMGLFRAAQIAAVDNGLGSLVRVDMQDRANRRVDFCIQ